MNPDEQDVVLDEIELARARARARQRAAETAARDSQPAPPATTAPRRATAAEQAQGLMNMAARSRPRSYVSAVPPKTLTAPLRGVGGAGVALGPLLRTAVAGMAASGSPGQRPDPTTTATGRYAQVERALLSAEDEFSNRNPVVATSLALAGAVPRYGLASVVPGGIPALAAAEAAASRPHESLAGLLGTVAEMNEAPELARRARNVSENTFGRIASDFVGGELIGGALSLAGRGYRAARGAARDYSARPFLEDLRERGLTQYADEAGPAGPAQGPLQGPGMAMPPGPREVPETDPRRLLAQESAPIPVETGPMTGPAIPMPAVGRTGFPSGFPIGGLSGPSLASGLRTGPEMDPQRLLAAVAQSLEGQRSSPWAPGPVQAQALQGQPIPPPYFERSYSRPIGPAVLEDPDATALRERLMEVLVSPPSQTMFRNPETRRMAAMGGGSATRHGPDVPVLRAEGGEGRRMLVPKQNVPGETVRDIQTRYTRQLAELLEGSYQGLEAVTPAMRSPVFRANTPLRTALDELAAPLSPSVRQMPESRVAMRDVDVRPAPENLLPRVPQFPPTELGPRPAVTSTTLDAGDFPYLVNRQAGGRGARPRAVTRPPRPVPVDRNRPEPMDLSPAVRARLAQRAAREEAAVSETERIRRSAMAEGDATVGETQWDRDFLSDAGAREDVSNLRSREGFTTPEMLMAMARGGGGGALGAGIGASAGETPEERKNFALMGLLLGAGGGLAYRPFGRQSAQNGRINEALDEIANVANRKGGNASPTATPFSSTGAPAGIQRQTITGAPGVAAASAGPVAADVGGRPVTRPTTVRAKDEPRLRRLNLTPEMEDLYGPRIRDLSREIARTEVERWPDLYRKAARLMNVMRENLAEVDPGRMNGPEALAISSLIRENTEALSRLAREYDSAVKPPAGVPVNQADVDRIAGEMNDLEAQTGELLTTFMRGTSAQGRALQANRVLANLTSDPTYWFVRGQRVKGSDVLTAAERNHITTLLNAGPAKREQLLKYIAGLRRTGFLGQIAQLRRAGLLTGLTGRAYDVAGTGANVVAETGARAMQAAFDRVASAVAARQVGGTAASRRSVLALTPNEASRMVRGLGTGIVDAGRSLGIGTLSSPRQWAKFIREAEIDSKTLARYDIPRNVNITMFGTSKPGQVANAIADTYQKFVMRLSGATDRIYRGAIYNGSMLEQARLVATREGLSGAAFQKRVDDLLQTPTDAMRANAMYQAELLTFTNDGALGRAIGNIIEAGAQAMAKSPAAGLAARLGEETRALGNILIPFRKTPANVFTRVAEHTPVLGWGVTAKRVQNWWGDLALMAAAQKQGLDASEQSANVFASQRKMVESLTRNVSGLGMFTLGQWMYQQGILTGDLPRDRAEAEQWRTEGRVPNAVLINGQWVPISRLAPAGTVLAVAANYEQERRQQTAMSPAERAGALVGTATRTVLDQPMLTGPQEMLEALTTKDDWKRESFSENFAGSFVPTGIAAATRAGGRQRMAEGPLDAVMARVPGMANDLPVRRNIFGEPLETGRGYLLPTTRDQRRQDPLVREMAAVGATVGAIKSLPGETEAQYEWRAEWAGRAVRARMQGVVASARYQSASSDRRRELLEEAAEEARRDFSKKIKKKYGIGAPAAP